MNALYITLGSISLALGVVGMFVPLLPTTPFLLLTACLYCKSSPRLYNWLLNHKLMGAYIRNFREHKSIPVRAKVFSVSLVWITILYGIFFVTGLVWIRVLLLGIAIGVSLHILSFKST